MTEEELVTGGLLAGLGAMLFFYIALLVLIVIAHIKIFTKAGKPGIAAIVPIWNLVVLCEICGKSPVWVVLLCIPIVNFICILILLNDLSTVFGKGGGFTLGLIFLSPIFFLILGFGSAQYIGPPAAPTAA